MITKCCPILFEKFVERFKLISEKENSERLKKTFVYSRDKKMFEYFAQPEFTLKRK